MNEPFKLGHMFHKQEIKANPAKVSPLDDDYSGWLMISWYLPILLQKLGGDSSCLSAPFI